jgi:hypothetical protein
VSEWREKRENKCSTHRGRRLLGCLPPPRLRHAGWARSLRARMVRPHCRRWTRQGCLRSGCGGSSFRRRGKGRGRRSRREASCGLPRRRTPCSSSTTTALGGEGLACSSVAVVCLLKEIRRNLRVLTTESHQQTTGKERVPGISEEDTTNNHGSERLLPPPPPAAAAAVAAPNRKGKKGRRWVEVASTAANSVTPKKEKAEEKASSSFRQ